MSEWITALILFLVIIGIYSLWCGYDLYRHKRQLRKSLEELNKVLDEFNKD